MPQWINLIVFDADDTLWYGLDGGYIAGTDYQDEGRNDYTFHKLDERLIQRNDGQRFRLYPEVPVVLARLRQQGVLISLASYNHLVPAMCALQIFGIDHFFQHPVIEWSSRKDYMLQRILKSFAEDGYTVAPQTTLFIDDDHLGKYRQQMADIGVNFLQYGGDIQNLMEILEHPVYSLLSASKHPAIKYTKR
jgi:magnesium-dependent phosphatase-1